jgi:uncharacterized membrane protein
MLDRIINHSYILITVVFAVASQFLMRWQATGVGEVPQGTIEKLNYFVGLIINPWILLAFIFTGLSGLSWFIAMTKFELSYAYPFISLNYILVLLFAPVILNESVSTSKILGTLVIVFGIIILSKD